jgi:hypothetical protein
VTWDRAIIPKKSAIKNNLNKKYGKTFVGAHDLSVHFRVLGIGFADHRQREFFEHGIKGFCFHRSGARRKNNEQAAASDVFCG